MRVIDGLEALEALVGSVLGTSAWIRLTPAMVRAFSDMTGDHQWIHLDSERAERELQGGRPIVQGFLTLSLIVRFRNEIAEVRGVRRVINYGLNRVRFPAPVPVGTRVRGTHKLLAAERLGTGSLRMTSLMTVEAEGVGKPACVAESVSLLYG